MVFVFSKVQVFYLAKKFDADRYNSNSIRFILSRSFLNPKISSSTTVIDCRLEDTRFLSAHSWTERSGTSAHSVLQFLR